VNNICGCAPFVNVNSKLLTTNIIPNVPIIAGTPKYEIKTELTTPINKPNSIAPTIATTKFFPDKISIAATTPAASATCAIDKSIPLTAITIVIPKVITIKIELEFNTPRILSTRINLGSII